MKYHLEIKRPLSVSIIVCARNEADNLPNLLEAIIRQEYDFAYVEVIVANDQSSDETEQILQEYAQNYPFIHYINIENRQFVRSPKKNALRQAIAIAKNEVLLLTDADCIPTPNWIASHIDVYANNPEAEMVAGLSKTNINVHKTPLMCQLFEHLDFLVLMYAAQGAIQAGNPFSCSGQNLSYRRNSFHEVGGFADIEGYLSGDDLLLMQKFVKEGKIVGFANFLGACVMTQPVNNWKELYNQRARWASNLKAMPTRNLPFFIYLVSCFVCIGLLPFLGIFYYLLAIFFGEADFIADATSLHNHEDYLTVRRAYTANPFWYRVFQFLCHFRLSYFWVWYIISPFYILTVTARGLFSVYRWNDRKTAL